MATPSALGKTIVYAYTFVTNEDFQVGKSMQAAVQTINAIGQITLGSHLAGQQVTVEPMGDSAWVVKKADPIPENEKWLYQGENSDKLDSALQWAAKHPATGVNTDTILAQTDLQTPAKDAGNLQNVEDMATFDIPTDLNMAYDGITDEMIKQRREVLRSRCCVSRSEWAQCDIDAELRRARDEDRF